MKWHIKKDKDLKKLILQGKKHLEISEILNTTVSSIRNRCYKLNLKIINHSEYICKYCNTKFIDYNKSKRTFCSSSCAAKFNNKGRVMSDETKKKISNKLKNKFYPKVKNIPLKKCRFCSEFKVIKKHKIICEDCKIKYYQFYRPACEFDFNIKQFINEFNFKLLEEYGWYRPSNKGNNLNGISKDHMYSVKDGFINNVGPEIIKHPANCQLLKHGDNNKKNTNSSITLNELKNRIKKWDNKYQ